MDVKTLIAELEKCNPDQEVSTEGCDCYGDVGSIDNTGDKVLLKRT